MKVINPLFAKEIIDTHNFNNDMQGLDDVHMSNSSGFDNVHDEIVPVDFSMFREVRIVKVEPNTKIESHTHTSPIFRIILKGGMTLNGVEYREGDWMVIPGGIEYQIEAGDIGYVAFCACYSWDNEVKKIS